MKHLTNVLICFAMSCVFFSCTTQPPAKPAYNGYLSEEELREMRENGRSLAGNLAIRCPAGLAFEAEEIPVTDGRMARNWPGSLWRVQLRSEKKEKFRAEFVFTDAD